MPATDKRNNSVDRRNRSHYANEGGPVERHRPAQKSQKAFTVISQSRSDPRSNIRSRSRSVVVDEINDRKRRNDYPQQQEHRSLKDKSTKERDVKYNDDKKNRERTTKNVSVSRNVKEDRNVKRHSDISTRRSTYEDNNIRQRNKNDYDHKTKNVSNKHDLDVKVRPKNAQSQDHRKSKEAQNELQHKKKSEKSDDRSRKLTKSEIPKANDSPKHQMKKSNTKAKGDLGSAASVSKSKAEKLPDEPKKENDRLDEATKGEDYYEDDFEDYESDFESDDDDDDEDDNDSSNKDEDSTNNETDEDSEKSNSNKKNSEKNIQEFKFQKPLNRRLSVTSFQEAKLSTLDNYEKQVLMKALKQENDYVEQYQNRLRSGHEEPVDIKPIDTAISVDDVPGSRRKSLQDGVTNFINFSHAKSRQTTLKELGKTLIRKKELIDSNRINLNEMVFDLFDLPPIDYETYIQSFGKANARQALSQTSEDDLHEEVQTDDIIVTEKWTQHPAHDFLGVGGEGVLTEDNEDLEKILRSNAIRFSKFVTQAGEVIINLLEENEIMSNKKINSESEHSDFSQEYFELGKLSFSAASPVTFVKFSATESHLLLTIHGISNEDESILDNHGLICIWNIHQPSFPQKYLICSSQPLCGCFNPGKANLVFAGLLDGSVIAWDLREPSSMHKSIKWNENEIILRFPAYITAEILHEETHHSSVVSLDSARIEYSSSSGSSFSEQQLTFYVASLEEYAILKLWTVMEVLQPNPSGTDTDLGLAPGSRIRLIRSSTINLLNLSGLNSTVQADLHTHEVRFLPKDSNTLLIATDMGIIIHCNNQGNKMIPSFYSSEYDSDLSEASCIDCAPNFSLFLVGCSDGSIRLHTNKKEKPVLMWPNATEPIVQIQWAGSNQFYALDNQSKIYKWDLSRSKSSPLAEKDFTNQRILHFHMNNESNSKHYSTSHTIHMAICFDTGNVEIHKIYLKQSSNEEAMIEILDSY